MLFKYMPDVKHVHTVPIKQDRSMPDMGSAEFKYAIAMYLHLLPCLVHSHNGFQKQ